MFLIHSIQNYQNYNQENFSVVNQQNQVKSVQEKCIVNPLLLYNKTDKSVQLDESCLEK